MKEYEYSFQVESIVPFINYCESNEYKMISEVIQNRIVYENKHSDKIIARLTTRIADKKKETILDFKNVDSKHMELKISNESQPVKITRRNKKVFESILDVLDFNVVANNFRTRYIYKKNNVKFEIDDYTEPKMQVVAIEGKQEEVDVVYTEIKKMRLIK